jgi:hypothetical protein
MRLGIKTARGVFRAGGRETAVMDVMSVNYFTTALRQNNAMRSGWRLR